jgi:protein-disulfide isomerase
VDWTSFRRSLATIARLGLAAIWIWAGWSKLQEPRTFLRAVRAYDATPEWLSKGIAYGLPTLEIALAVVLLLGVVVRVAAAVSAFLFVIFIIGIAQASARGIKLACGCFGGGGTSDKTTYILDIARDAGLLVVAVYLVVWPLSYYALETLLIDEHEVAPPSAKRVRRDPRALQKYQAARAARAREAAGKQRFITILLSVVVVLVCLIGISVQSSRAKIAGTVVATNASVSDGVTVGKTDAPITVDVFEDFQCPICENFESTTNANLSELVTAGTIRIHYHTMAFLDSSSSGNRYSSRAANAAICASDVDTATFKAYHDVLYGKDANGVQVQPEEGGDGRTDADLEAYFKLALPTATDDQVTAFASCVTSETHAALVAAITDNASKRHVTGTPTVMVGGDKVATVDKDNVLKAITDAQAKLKK